MPITPYDFIDSATDAGEGWNTFGSQERGVLPILQDGVGGFGALASEPQEFRHFSSLDQRQILNEIEANPSFGKKLTAWMHQPNGAKLISDSAKRAALNEMYPKEHPESRGEWITLRKRLAEILRDIPAAIQKNISKLTPEQRIAIVRTMGRGGHIEFGLGATTAPALTAPTTGGGDIWGSLIGGIAGAAASIYSAKITADATKDIAKIQAQTTAQQTAAQQQIAANQAAIDAARARAAGGTIDPATGQIIPSSGGGFPLWILPVGLGILGLVLFFVLR